MSRLITRCVCNFEGPFPEFVASTGLPVAECEHCGVLHQITDIAAAEVHAQYLGPYHSAADRHPGCVPYAARYEHDLQVSAKRWDRYEQLLNGRLTVPYFYALDVGAANGAWIDYLRKDRRLMALGVDPDLAMTRDAVMHGTIQSIDGEFSLVTYHDVLEHVVNPLAELTHARARVRPGGVIVLDVPDVFGGRGDHHYKTEHIWFFNEDSLRSLLERADFRPLAADRPIPGKMVVYGEAI